MVIFTSTYFLSYIIIIIIIIFIVHSNIFIVVSVENDFKIQPIVNRVSILIAYTTIIIISLFHL
jgi:hypothetical protein